MKKGWIIAIVSVVVVGAAVGIIGYKRGWFTKGGSDSDSPDSGGTPSSGTPSSGTPSSGTPSGSPSGGSPSGESPSGKSENDRLIRQRAYSVINQVGMGTMPLWDAQHNESLQVLTLIRRIVSANPSNYNGNQKAI